jgi:hypothetical protein
MPKKPKGFGKFDALMRKLVKVPAEAVMTNEQKRLLNEAHGTPEQFAIAVNAAADDLMCTTAEAEAAIERYRRDWAEAWPDEADSAKAKDRNERPSCPSDRYPW